jgi:hypothetical protein
MAYYLRELATKCHGCLRKPAVYELMGPFNTPYGKFCERCARLRMSERNAIEAKESNVRIQDVKA